MRFADFTTLTRSHTPRRPVATEEAMWVEVLRLLLPFLDRRENPRRLPIRLIGVRAERLMGQERYTSADQLPLGGAR